MQVADYTKVVPQSEAHGGLELERVIPRMGGPAAARPLSGKDG